jgi:hypothetical protein
LFLNSKFEHFYGIEIDFERANDLDESIEQDILSKLNAYRLIFIQE